MTDLLSGGRHGNYVTWLYVLMKLVYIIQVLCQFMLLNAFLAPNYTLWGFGILRDIIDGREWEVSGHFPRLTKNFRIEVGYL